MSTAAFQSRPSRIIRLKPYFTTLRGPPVVRRRSAIELTGLKSRKNHHSKPEVVALVAHAVQQLFAIAIVNITQWKVGTFDLVNTNEEILIAALIEVNSCMNKLAHMLGQGQMDRLVALIRRDLDTIAQWETGNGVGMHFQWMKT